MKRPLFLAALLFAAAPALAQRADLPPEPAIAQALDSHPSVEAAAQRVAAARAEAGMLRRGPHEVTVGGSYLRRSVDREGGFDEFDGTVTRAFRLPGKARLDRRAGELGVEVAENMQEDARHQAALMLSDRWHDWQIAGALVRLDAEAVANYRAELRAIRDRADVRDASWLDVDQVESALALAETRLADSRAAEAQARVALASAFPGLPLPPQAPPMTEPELPPESIDTLCALVISRSHEIGAAARDAERLDTVAMRIERDRFADPSVGVRLFSERSGAERGAGLVFSLPLGGGYRRSVADQARAQAGAARFDEARVRREVAETARSDAVAVGARMSAWESAGRAVDAASSASRRSQRGYRLGAIDMADMLYVRRQEIEARRAEIRARGEALRAILKIRIDSHTVWAPDED
ncbi:TolC family protein [Stakelama tenebrarum]|uniref:TolC family protein n=1 Tax=Stakelama tenebrarum TaxID=2711215 RepID=A0A6G6Y3A4_9SPHN|nr:TolC family protein [Sphingosinithalassobacter tenebrarum]QIG79046.1 TolC family protein [Sphingosinithalassobacter tenebrarum]